MKLSDIFNVGSNIGTKATQAVGQVVQSQTDFKQGVDEVKDAAVKAYAVTTTLQLLSTIAICTIAYVTVKNYQKGRR